MPLAGSPKAKPKRRHVLEREQARQIATEHGPERPKHRGRERVDAGRSVECMSPRCVGAGNAISQVPTRALADRYHESEARTLAEHAAARRAPQ